MKTYWDSINNWFHLGYDTKMGHGKIIILLDDWMGWFHINSPGIRDWTLFQIMWDNGAWWGLDLDWETSETKGDYKTKTGDLTCFYQIKILGIGIRYYYSRNITVMLPSLGLLLKHESQKI